jgi:signal peptidase I
MSKEAGVILLVGVLLLVTGCVGNGTKTVTVSRAPSGPRTTYHVPSQSMEPTYKQGQEITVAAYGSAERPGIGDVVVFYPPSGTNTNTCGVPKPDNQMCGDPTPGRDSVRFLKRVVAVGGDRISLRGGTVVLNGVQQQESYASPCPRGSCNFPKTVRVRPGFVFLLGDDRAASDDSRFWGPIPEAWIIGKVVG